MEQDNTINGRTYVGKDGEIHTEYKTGETTVTRPIDEPWFEAPLRALALLPANWNSYGARPIDQRAIAALRAMLAQQPAIVPTSKGGVQLEWHTPHGDYEIEILPNGLQRVDEADEWLKL